jgi:hypothetical protein
MKISEIFAVAGLAAVAAFSAPLLAGQTASAPIVVKSSPSSSAKAIWLKAEVIHADLNSMIVREQGNSMMIHTFTYAPQVQTQMQRIVDQGGYQYGDKIMILCQHGQEVALKLRGKPSKAL